MITNQDRNSYFVFFFLINAGGWLQKRRDKTRLKDILPLTACSENLWMQLVYLCIDANKQSRRLVGPFSTANRRNRNSEKGLQISYVLSEVIGFFQIWIYMPKHMATVKQKTNNAILNKNEAFQKNSALHLKEKVLQVSNVLMWLSKW